MKHFVPLLLIGLLVASCASAPPKYTSQDVAAAQSREQQVQLYDSLGTAIQTDRNNAAAYQRLQAQLGQELGQEEAARIRETLDAARLDSGQVPLDVIGDARNAAAPVQKWNNAAYQGLAQALNTEESATTAALETLVARADILARENERVAQVVNLRQIAELYGDNAEASMAYNVAYEDLHSLLESNGMAALRRGDYRNALRNLQELQAIDPAYPGIDDMITSARLGIESGDFRQQIIDADFDGAWATFTALSGRQLEPEEFAEYVGPARNLAEYFAGRAATNVRLKAYNEAYDDILKEKTIRRWIGESSQVDRQTLSRFTEAMFDLSDASRAEERFGLEFGFLLLVEEFDADYATLDARLRESSDIIYRNAIRGVGAITIKSADPSDQQIASQISAGVRQYLMQNIPDDVEIFEREMLDEIKRERQMDDDLADGSKEFVQLESADYLIQGELLEADVITEINPIRSRKRIVTGQVEVPNPAYEQWIREKGKRKADHPDAPPKTILQDETENIEMVVEHHRKYGEVGVSYWVTDAISSKHLHSNSVTRKFDQSDESQEGIQIGTFEQEAKLAQLPSDIEIYNVLIDDVVDTMARDLVDFLANPEGDYFASCNELANEQEFIDAAEFCANAVVLRQKKQLDSEEMVNRLKAVTLDSGMRAD